MRNILKFIARGYYVNPTSLFFHVTFFPPLFYFFFCFVILLYNIIIVSNFGHVPYLVYLSTSRCTSRLTGGIILPHIFLCLSFVILKWPQDVSSYLPACTADADTSLATNMHSITLFSLYTHTIHTHQHTHAKFIIIDIEIVWVFCVCYGKTPPGLLILFRVALFWQNMLALCFLCLHIICLCAVSVSRFQH